jgi:hypothetical protein
MASSAARHAFVTIAVASFLSVVACGSPVLSGVGNVAKGFVTKPAPPDPSTPEGQKLQAGCAVCKARFAGCTTCQTEFSKCTFEQAMDTYGYCKL